MAKQKATYWLRAARGWRRWRRMVMAVRVQKRVLAACLLRHGLHIGSQLVGLVLVFLGLRPSPSAQEVAEVGVWGAGGDWTAGRDRAWDDSNEATQLLYILQDDASRHGARRWRNLRGLTISHRSLEGFAFDDLWSAAELAYRQGSRSFECFWQRTPGGGWDVWVQLGAGSLHEVGWSGARRFGTDG